MSKWLPKFEYLLKEYSSSDKDVIFLVNEDTRTREGSPISDLIKNDIELKIFKKYIEVGDTGMTKSGNKKPAITHGDRISLMSYGKNVKKMFNLTQVDENPTHLENQIERLQFAEPDKPDKRFAHMRSNQSTTMMQQLSNSFISQVRNEPA